MRCGEMFEMGDADNLLGDAAANLLGKHAFSIMQQ